MKIISHIDEFIDYRKIIDNQTIGFVPTMGALHDGHLSLVNSSNEQCDITIVSIFVNPTQFSIDEDLETYPQNIEQDKKLLDKYNVDVLFVPNKSAMYDNEFSTFISEKHISKYNEGKSRPLFFSGVLTIVSKLFNIIEPSHAFFGMKDAQQLIIVKKMIKDLNYNIKIIECPTIRERNGLAMSSRNQYLSEAQKNSASIIYKSLIHATKMIDSGEVSVKNIKQSIKDFLGDKNIKIDYISIVNQNSFQTLNRVNGNIIILIAVFINNVRLIDNIYYSQSSK